MASFCPKHIEELSYDAGSIERSIYLIVRFKGLEKSRHLNGLTGQIIGYTGMTDEGATPGRPYPIRVFNGLVSEEDFRYHVQLNHSRNRKQVSVKLKNLDIVRQTLSTPLISDSEVMEHIRKLLLNLKPTTAGTRKDISMRQSLYSDALKYYDETHEFPNELLSTIACVDLSVGNRIALSDFDPLMKRLTSILPVCQGNGLVDFHAFSLGLFADGENICSICLDAPMIGEPVSLLPCGHVFHQKCMNQYETARAAAGEYGVSCPNCKKAIVAESWTHYRKSTNERICDRFGEFLLSGFCVNCMIVMVEGQQIYEKFVGSDTETGDPVYGHIAGSCSDRIQAISVGPTGMRSLLQASCTNPDNNSSANGEN
jgi:ssDNA-binding Zn-finger/Zn-ribbon topoisomerase 1